MTVGYATMIQGNAAQKGFTLVYSRGQTNHDPVFEVWFSFNGNSEMTGFAWQEKDRFLEGPIAITDNMSSDVRSHNFAVEPLVGSGSNTDFRNRNWQIASKLC